MKKNGLKAAFSLVLTAVMAGFSSVFAMAPAGEEGSNPASYMTWVWLILMALMFYFLLIRPQKKKEKADRILRNNLQPGDEIVTIGGFTGKVLSVKDDDIVFETGAAKTKLTVKKWAIQSRISPEQEIKETPAAEEKPGTEESKTEETKAE